MPVSELFAAYILLITCCSQAMWELAPYTASDDGIFVLTNAAASHKGKFCTRCSKRQFLKAELVGASRGTDLLWVPSNHQ